jgi:UDP-N-acetylglucosamine 2-epimerase (non-hydrolysing)
MKVLCVVGARPNFVKIAPIMRSLAKRPGFEPRLVHTGQHYDAQLSDVFFEQLGIPAPDIHLGVGPGTQTGQTAEIMRLFEPVLEAEQPEVVLVVGDVNSTLACALATAKFRLHRPFGWYYGPRFRPIIVHVEAGLRSFDNDMPEETNRRLTDAISDVLCVSEPSGLLNLGREGVPQERMHFVGNVMIDTLMSAREGARKSGVLERLRIREGEYGFLTLHRPGNVDDAGALRELLETLDQIAGRLPLVFPVHPRTRARLDAAGIALPKERWTLTDPVGYLECLELQTAARLVLTDSGGVQEETTALGVPCLTLRDNTERPCTVSEGTNRIAGTTRDGILRAFDHAMAAKGSRERLGRIPDLWDGKAADRVADILAQGFEPSLRTTAPHTIRRRSA